MAQCHSHCGSWQRSDTSVAILSKELSLPAWSARWSLSASLEHSLPHVVSHGLAALFLVLPDHVPDLFDPIDDLPKSHKRICLSIPTYLRTLTLWHVLRPPSRPSTRTQTEHAAQLSAPHLLGRSEVHVPHIVSSRSGLLHQSTQFGHCR